MNNIDVRKELTTWSLTAFLKRTGQNEVNDFFKSHFPNPGVQNNINLLVPTEPSKSAVKIGLTFDLIVNEKIDLLNSNNSKKIDQIEKGFKLMILNKYNNPWESDEYKAIYKDHIKLFESHLKFYRKFLSSGRFTLNTAEAYLYLSNYYLNAHQCVNFKLPPLEYEEGYSNQLLDLYKLTKWNRFKGCEGSKSLDKSHILSGTIDFSKRNTIFDIKTIQEVKFNRSQINQIVGYLFLSVWEEEYRGIKNRFSQSGIYFSRHGYFWKSEPFWGYSKIEFRKLAIEFKHIVDSHYTDEERKRLKERRTKSWIKNEQNI